ncbi:MAG: hypothetical protein FD129_3078, partial [bacterium]
MPESVSIFLTRRRARWSGHLAAVPLQPLLHVEQAVGALVVLLLEQHPVALGLGHLLLELLQLEGQRLDHLGGQAHAHQLFMELLLALGDLVEMQRAGLLGHDPQPLLPELGQFRLHLDDVPDRDDHLGLDLLDGRFAPFRAAEIDVDELLELELLLGQEHRAGLQLAHGRGGLEEGIHDPMFRLLDPLRDDDFPLAIEQRHLAHLAQVHADRIVVADRRQDRGGLGFGLGHLGLLGLPHLRQRF